MDELIGAALARLRRSTLTWPDVRGWIFAGGVGGATLALMFALGAATGLYRLGPANTHGIALRLATTLAVPAIGEEVAFRGLLVPGRAENSRPWWALTAATAIFVAWHVAEATTFLKPAAAMFLRPDFLACAGVLGAGAGLIRWRTESLWPAVALHWLMVTLWQTWFGGFTLQ